LSGAILKDSRREIMFICDGDFIITWVRVLMGAFVWLKSIRDDGVRRFANRRECGRRFATIADIPFSCPGFCYTSAGSGGHGAPVARWCSPVL
ncbi:hypothetical protein HAX54_047761, partial [Datura stramonium]|nr:hypothetical protein [Datura stramonium]